MGWVYPCQTVSMMLARLYATDSAEYTHNYGGWENEARTLRKLNRIVTGRLGQIWTAEFCSLNGIPVKGDTTSPQLTDNTDLEIAGRAVDVKSSISEKIHCQVNSGMKSKPTDFYLFLLFRKENFGAVEPLGFITKEAYFAQALFVGENEFFPGTKLQNKYKSGSYVLSPQFLTPFHQTLSAWRRGDEQLTLTAPAPGCVHSYAQELFSADVVGRSGALEVTR